jgi:2-methylcitrate dehydratase PrpD
MPFDLTLDKIEHFETASVESDFKGIAYMTNITSEISKFAADVSYDDLPYEVVKETKRLILDSIGCTVGGIETEKGRIAIRFGEEISGDGNTTILGHKGKVSPSASAFANGELMNALDYESLLSPPEHLTPYVLPACITCGEMKDVSGKELIAATAVAHEITTRISESLVFGNRFGVKLQDRDMAISLPTPGYGLCMFGGIAGAGRLLGFKAEELANAMGIGGYSVPVPLLARFTVTAPTTMTKYLSSGLLSQMEITAVLLSQFGHTGDKEILDGEYGLFRYFGSDNWSLESVIKGLGEEWLFHQRIFYKWYPCCGAMQNVLGLFDQIIAENRLQPDEIEEVTVILNLLAELPAWKNEDIRSHVDIQFNTPFIFALVANRVKAGPLWQSDGILNDERVREFMNKVKVLTSLDREAIGQPQVKVVALKDNEQKIYSQSGLSANMEMSEKDLIDKFRRNASGLIEEKNVDEAIDLLLGLEDVKNISSLFKVVSS